MDAIDTTYQNIPVVLEEPVKDEFSYEGEVPVEGAESDSSFEKLMSSLLEKKEVGLSLEDNVEFLEENLPIIMEENLENDSLLLESFSNENISEELTVELEVLEQPVVEGEMEEVPFVEYELDVSSKIENIVEDDKKNKVDKKKESPLVKDIKDEKDVKKDEVPLEAVSYVARKKDVKIEKPNVKKEEKIKESEGLDVLEDLPPIRHKEKLAKKLPIEVEDLRSIEENIRGEEKVEEGFSNGDFSSESRASNQNYMDGSTSSLTKSENVEGAREGGFTSILAEQIRAEAASIVERGKIVLRDGNVGEIRLQLKPEHLGTLRIQIKLSGDKKLEGEVSVSSKEAYDAFENAKNDIIMAFENAGFESSSFNLNWKGEQNARDVREFDVDKYFSAEKTHQSLSEKLNSTENNMYKAEQAKNLNILA